MGLVDKIRLIDKSTQEIQQEIPQEIEDYEDEWDAEDSYAQDPQPEEIAPTASKKRITLKSVPAPSSRASAKIRKEVAEEIEATLELLAAAWSITDEECADVLSETSKKIAERAAEILAKNPRLLARFRQGSFLMDWAKFGISLKPLCKAVYQHHVKRIPAGGETYVDLADFPAYRTA